MPPALDRAPWEQLLNAGFCVGPGAMGTMLQQAALPFHTGGEAWNLNRPEQVIAVHRAYVEAGAGWLVTNSFGGNRLRLEALQLADRVAAVNAAAVRLAREAARGVPVLGSMGPTGGAPQDWPAVYREQAEALAAAGVDALLVETIVSLEEGLEAVRQARETGTPVWAAFTPGADGRLLDHAQPERAAEALVRAGASVIGVNCGFGPESLLEPARRLARAGLAPVLAAPSAGLPLMEAGKALYPVLPDGFAAAAIQFRDAGVRFLAGCCGTTPSHIRAAVRAVRQNSLHRR